MPAIPVLETARLRLRGHITEDFKASAAMWADPAVTRYISGRPFTREESWARLQRYVGHWALLDYGFWAITEKATGGFIGEAGLADFMRELASPLDNCPEAGWVLATSAHGKGFASEALQAISAWGDKRFGGAQTICLIAPENVPSIRVAEKAGYRETERVEYKGEPVVLFARTGRAIG
jgi:RimJ/RimL family protein N-acetyltransferase